MRSFLSKGIKRLMQRKTRYVRGDRDAHVLAVATIKGGVGKTTTAVNLAAAMARDGLQVLLVDLDAQGHCSACLSSTISVHPPAMSLSTLLMSDASPEVLEACVDSGIDGLDVTPADSALSEAEGRMGQKLGREMLLRDALDVTRSHYDVIVLDCPPNSGNLTMNALVAADSVLIPTELSPLAQAGAEEMLSTVLMVRARLEAQTELLGVLLTRVDGRSTTVNTPVLERLEERFGEALFETRIGQNTDLSKAQLAGQTIFDFAPRSRGAQAYDALLDEVLERLEMDAAVIAA